MTNATLLTMTFDGAVVGVEDMQLDAARTKARALVAADEARAEMNAREHMRSVRDSWGDLFMGYADTDRLIVGTRAYYVRPAGSVESERYAVAPRLVDA